MLLKFQYFGTQGRVSIHAHQYWRAMPGRLDIGIATTYCFNPRPPILAGDASVPQAGFLHAPVSIHAHQYWRAMQRHGAGPGADVLVSIHAHQYWRAMP